jgi:hypothetical protein
MTNEVRTHFIAIGLIHNGPPTYGPNHFAPNGGRRMDGDELYRAGFPVAAAAKRNRALGIQGEVPAYFYNGG